MKTLRSFTRQLRGLGFVPGRDSRAGGIRVWSWTKQTSLDRMVEVQFWGDGGHHVTHERNGCQCTRPTDFNDVPGMLVAIEYESNRQDNTYQRNYR